MIAGRLRHRITIQAPAPIQNAFGEPAPSWATFAETWAEREDLTNGRELFASGQMLATVPTRYTLRYLAGVSAAMRVLCNGALYDINNVLDPDGRGRTLVLLTTRKD